MKTPLEIMEGKTVSKVEKLPDYGVHKVDFMTWARSQMEDEILSEIAATRRGE